MSTPVPSRGCYRQTTNHPSIGLAQRFAGRRRQRHHRFPKGNEVVLHIFGSPFLIDVFTVRAALTASSPYDISFH
jgi:hypothetical protein